ncbi:DUF2778 domain-containing protein [Roseibium sp.]|uniref:DUF2778 domain-containing protein n=1 Tax=Roseibium sp. TaxID=1936156 RepID=UPI003A97E7E3
MSLSKKPSARRGAATAKYCARGSRKALLLFLALFAGIGATASFVIGPQHEAKRSLSAPSPSLKATAATLPRSAAERAMRLARAIAPRIDGLEAEVSRERKQLEADIRSAKAQLTATLFASEHRYRKAAERKAARLAANETLETAGVSTGTFRFAAPEDRMAVAALTTPVPSSHPLSARARGIDPQVSTTMALGYAAAGDPTADENGPYGGLSKIFNTGKISLPGRGSGIAVYDISAATVYMPDGSKLEAHSGIGKMLDNPRYTKVKNKGPTPPNIYNLRMRERRFHGVEAIRMLPVDHAAMHGRDGMLTHTNLLRGRIGSHGCVAFKNYDKFLKAFKAGKVTKLIVVPELKKLPVYMAAL